MDMRGSVLERFGTFYVAAARCADPSGLACSAAPEGRSNVATGGAAAQPMRNPWKAAGELFFLSYPPRRGGGITFIARAPGAEAHMPGTYSQILLHVVFSTQHREAWITPEISESLYAY